MSSMAAAVRRHRRIVVILAMIVYLILLFYLLFFSEAMGRTIEVEEYHYNLVLFKEIRRFITQWRKVGLWAAALNIAGNVIAFMPFGCFMAYLLRPRDRWYVITLLSFLLSVSVEALQLFTRSGCFDVDDLFLNTAGGLCGYLVYQIACFLHRKRQGLGNVSKR